MASSDIPLRRCVTCDSWQPDRKSLGFGECTNPDGKCQGWYNPGEEYHVRCAAYTPKLNKKKKHHEEKETVGAATQKVGILLEQTINVRASEEASQKYETPTHEETTARNELEGHHAQTPLVGRLRSQPRLDLCESEIKTENDIRNLELEI